MTAAADGRNCFSCGTATAPRYCHAIGGDWVCSSCAPRWLFQLARPDSRGEWAGA